MRTPCRAAPTSRHFPISEYRQLRGLQERLVRIDEPSRPIPVKANLIMYEQDHARTFSERSNHAAEEKKTLPAPCQNRSLGALPFARREHVARHRVCRRRPSGKRRTGERPARSSAKRSSSPLGKVAIPENSFGYDSQISLASQNEGEGGASTTGEGNASADGSGQAAGEGVASEAGVTPEEADPIIPKGIPKSARILSKQRQTHSLSPISRTTTSTTRRPTPA